MFLLTKAGVEHEAVRSWDTLTALLKRHTLFNVLSFTPYVTQNLATGVFMNAAKLGVGPKKYVEAVRLRKAVQQAVEAAAGQTKHFDAELARILPDPNDFALAKALRDEGHFGSGQSFFDSGAEVARLDKTTGRKVAEFGTKNTTAANQFVEETMRGAAFLKGVEDGLPFNEASDMVRSIHLEYSAIGRTRLERDVINRFVFFPTWLMRAPTAIVRAYAHNPALFNQQARLEMGSDWYDRDIHEYGELLGPRLSGPASFLSGLGYETG
jgi:hypothetical protein